MVASNFWITIFEIFVLSFLIFHYLSLPKDKSRLRFLMLTLMFIIYNVISGLLPNPDYNINIIVQNCLAFGSGIALAIHYYYYLVIELKMGQDKLFNLRVLILGLILTFVFGFIFTSLFANDIKTIVHYYIIFPIIIALYFCFKSVTFLLYYQLKPKEKDTPYKLMITSGYIGIIFMATMPIVVFFGDYQTINNSLVNISFFVTFYAYFKYQSYKTNLRFEIVKKMNTNFDLKNKIDNENSIAALQDILTKKEFEVANYILQNLLYKNIAKKMFIGEKTVGKHASNIYKKTNSEDKIYFIKKYSSISKN